MATLSQIDANRENARFSTGPVTEEGKQTSSRNSLTLGLYTRQDYVKPEERDIYQEFCETLYRELCPETLLEQSLTAEITGASWRLRRCSAVEGELADCLSACGHLSKDPMLDDKSEKTRKSLERARASAHSLLHRSINQLRRLQTERLTRCELLAPNPVPAWTGIADYKQIAAAVNANNRATQPKGLTPADLDALTAPPPQLPDFESASFCSTEIPVPAARPQTPRNAPCPCRSGQKYKRCCGKNAPPVLNLAA